MHWCFRVPTPLSFDDLAFRYQCALSIWLFGNCCVFVIRRSGAPAFPRSGVLQFRSLPFRRLCSLGLQHSSIPAFRHSGVPVFRHSGVPAFRRSGDPEIRASRHPDIPASCRLDHVGLLDLFGGVVVLLVTQTNRTKAMR
ncbi:hypothetical protein PINS_up013566 [Pythium insidiosum]|nr:hypothetical protein PINS_up013564 [Pythium insidiosum]GLE04597.1 hypothetical protein PINS_up013566 [Pythium insidiosum]